MDWSKNLNDDSVENSSIYHLTCQLSKLDTADWEQIMDWSKHLNDDLLEEVVSRLDSFSDYTRLRATCKTWRSLLPKFWKNLIGGRPCLMLPYSGHCDFVRLFVGENGEVFKLEVPLDEYMVCRGSSNGWLIMLENSPSIKLVNPLKPDTLLELPPLHTIRDVVEYCPEKTGAEYVIRGAINFRMGIYGNFPPVSLISMKHTYIHKVVLSCNPTRPNCLAMMIYGDHYKLACCRLGDERWSSVDEGGMKSHVEGGWWSHVEDITHQGGKFYIVDFEGTVIVISDKEIMDNRSSPKPQLLVRAPDGFRPIDIGRLYLVAKSPEELLMVNRDIYDDASVTFNFDIFKLDLKSRSWSKIDSLGEHVLFLGVNESFSISSNTLPGLSFKENCIYFTDAFFPVVRNDQQQIVGGSDVGIFDLNKRSMLTLPVPLPGYESGRTRIWPPPVWIQMSDQ